MESVTNHKMSHELSVDAQLLGYALVSLAMDEVGVGKVIDPLDELAARRLAEEVRLQVEPPVTLRRALPRVREAICVYSASRQR